MKRNSLTKIRPSIRADRTGAAIVEMAVVAPVLILLVLGVLEFGRAFMASHLITNASREGARMAILDGNTNADVQTFIISELQAALPVDPADVAVVFTVTQVEDGTTSTDITTAGQRDLIAVDVTVAFSEISWSNPNWLAGASLRGNSSMRKD